MPDQDNLPEDDNEHFYADDTWFKIRTPSFLEQQEEKEMPTKDRLGIGIAIVLILASIALIINIIVVVLEFFENIL